MTDGEVIRSDTAGEAAECVIRLLAKARYRVDIESLHLDPLLYDRRGVRDALRRLVVKAARRARVRIVVRDAAPLVQAGHRLLELSRQLTSFVEIRELSSEDAAEPAPCVIVDGEHYLRWQADAGYVGSGRWNNRGHAGRSRRHFNERWERAAQPPALRRLQL